MRPPFFIRSLFALACVGILLSWQNSIAQQKGGLTPRMQAEVNKAELEALKQRAPENGIYWSERPSVPVGMLKAVDSTRSNREYRFSIFAPNGGWLIGTIDGGVRSNGLPQEANEDLNRLVDNGTVFQVIRHAAFSAQGAWFYNFGQNEGAFHSNKLPPKLLDKLWEIQKATRKTEFPQVIMSIALTQNNGWVLVYRMPTPPNPLFTIKPRKWEAIWDNVPDDFVKKLVELQNRQAGLRIIFPPKGGWLILFNNTDFAASGIPKDLEDKLLELKNSGKRILDVAVSPNNAWVIVTNGKWGW